jgi:arginyl-tRNA--protein-N-Asp/Glu arginylyltransferase
MDYGEQLKRKRSIIMRESAEKASKKGCESCGRCIAVRRQEVQCEKARNGKKRVVRENCADYSERKCHVACHSYDLLVDCPKNVGGVCVGNYEDREIN